MATGNVVVQGSVSGGTDGARTFGPATTALSSAVEQTLTVALSSGPNTVTVPSGTSVAIIVPPNNSAPGTAVPNPAFAGTLTLKGVSGDTGIAISNYGVTKLDWSGSSSGNPSPPANFVINASTSCTVVVWFA